MEWNVRPGPGPDAMNEADDSCPQKHFTRSIRRPVLRCSIGWACRSVVSSPRIAIEEALCSHAVGLCEALGLLPIMWSHVRAPT
jgi:hypothetical protein